MFFAYFRLDWNSSQMRTMEVETEVPRDIKDVTTVAHETLSSVTGPHHQRDMADESPGTNPISSPGITNLSLTDYYTIAIMADKIDSPSSIVDSKFLTLLALPLLQLYGLPETSWKRQLYPVTVNVLSKPML